MLLLAAGLCGCIGDDISVGNNTVDMVLSLDTYAAGDDPNASTNETVAKSAWVYIFNENGVLENPGATSVPLAHSGEAADAAGKLNRTWRVAVGRKDIYVLLNAGHLTRNGTAVELASFNPYSKAELETLMTDPANFATDFPAEGTDGMLMSGKLDVNVTSQTSLVTVPVARRYARIDLGLRRKADLAGATVVVRSVTFKNRRETAAAFAPETESTGADAVYLNDHDDVTIGAGTTDYTAVASFYTMPRTGAAKAACLELAVDIDGRALSLPVYVNSGALGGNGANNENLPLDIAANKIYKVDVSLSRQSTQVTMNVLEWDEEPVGGDIQGSSLIVDSLVRVSAGSTTAVPVYTKAAKIAVKLSGAAVTAGYSLDGADSGTGVLELDVVDGCAEIPVRGPVAYPVGPEYTMTVVAGNIRRNTLLRVDGDPVLEVGDEIVEFLFSGETKPYRVTSYIELGDDARTKFAVPWTAEFSTDGGTTWTTGRPAWLTAFTAAGAGNTLPDTYSASVAAQIATVSFPSDDALKAAASVSNVDLSMKGESRNTANCYLVNAPGTYTFPLVYGNAVEGGAPNTTAYTSTQSGTNILTQFVNHLGAAIDHPYIYNNAGCVPADACLVWQDAEGLVRNVALTADRESISFEVPRATIRQGNAIVAVRDASGTIMWSWHIWVTDYVLGSDLRRVTDSNSYTHDFMPVNLGWCNGDTNNYAARGVLVKLTQPATGMERTFKLDQPAASVVALGNAPYYQWGRKDPMLPGLFADGSYSGDDKSCYTDIDKVGYAFNSRDLYSNKISEFIKNPHCFNTYDYMDEQYYNLWNADNNTWDVNNNTVVKTVYDPSPAGYCLPPLNAFTGTTAYGNLASGEGYFGYLFNSPYTSVAEYRANNGWVFYCNKMDRPGEYNPGGGTVYFPAVGFRGSSIVFGSGSGRYWTGTALSADNGGLFSFGESQINPYIDSYRGGGLSVRSIREN